MGFLGLFIVATMPVLQILIVTALGSFLATSHANILGEEARKHLNNIVFFVFNPALVATMISKTITYESIVKLWFMPFNILITYIIGSALGLIVIQLTRPPEHFRGLIIGCSAAGNLGNMLLIIIPAVCKEKGSPFGAPDICHTYGMAYASLSMAIGAIYLWSYVYNIMRISSKRIPQELEMTSSAVSSSAVSVPCKEASISPTLLCIEPQLDSKDLTIAGGRGNQFVLHSTISGGEAKVTVFKKLKKQIKMILGKINLKAVFSPSTTGAIIGFIVGLIPHIRKSMIGDGAPLRVIQDSATLVGDGAVPTLTLILGGNLLKGLRRSEIQNSLIVGIIIARYMVLPLMGILVVKAAVRFGFVDSSPLYQFVLLLQFALPPAMNIGTIAQLFGDSESECSVIMLWTYAFASISLTIWSTVFMWLVT